MTTIAKTTIGGLIVAALAALATALWPDSQAFWDRFEEGRSAS
jgi:hypothetical protein